MISFSQWKMVQQVLKNYLLTCYHKKPKRQQQHMRTPFAMSDRFHPFLPSGRQRLLYQLAGVVPSPLLLELLSCPLCARSLETLELELGDLEGGRGEAGLHDFPQVRMYRGCANDGGEQRG